VTSVDSFDVDSRGVPRARTALVPAASLSEGAMAIAEGPALMLDCSLSLINQTGAHVIAQDLAAAFEGSAIVRRFRLLGRPLPQGLMRKALGRMMLRELRLGHDRPLLLWPEPSSTQLRRVFLDPLYVLRSRLEPSDVVLCHDIGPITHPALYDASTIRLYRAAYAKIKRVAPGVVFVSEASRRAFESVFRNRYRFLAVIPLYVRGGSIDGESEPVDGVGSRFLLTVGALERRKNQVMAIRAFAASGLHARGFEYVLCGARGDGATEILAQAKSTRGVRILGYVRDAQLRWLYRTATAFVLPSLLEGFGMPALEAARYGLIPILSRDSALTEAVGGLGFAVAPDSPGELSAAFREVAAMDAEQRDSLGRALIEHAASATRERFIQAWRSLLQAELGRVLVPQSSGVA
jgi:glycosyltransferase involved in cell wall biosynthesis